jgi:cytochrome c biogenesis protein CcmG/thiol:disulfide interchange protein DsbE
LKTIKNRRGQFFGFLFLLSCCLLMPLQPVHAELKSQPMLKNYIDSAEYQGKWVYLDFWASWCAPCKASFPFMNRLQSKFQAGNFTVLAINVDENTADAKGFLSEHQANFPVVFDAQGKLPQAFNVQVMPTSYLINPSGEIVWQHHGFLEKDIKTIVSIIQQKMRGV